MGESEHFDLSQFLTDSLSLQINAPAPTRPTHPLTVKDRYLELTQLHPLDVLGERSFGQPQEISEDTVGTPIQEFFRGANVLVTGGTGFVGKVLTEKLVRSIPHLGHVYLLIRTKKGKTSQERFDQLLEDRVFLRMKTEVPHYHTKISVVDGDISESDLGLSEAARQMLLDKVHVVFHSAADVRFTEPLRVAIESNVLGSKRIVDLAKEMKLLKSYVHVSTAYSHCVRRVIEESVPKLNISYKELLKYIESKTDAELEQETKRILQGWPNTYTFSKAVCEEMVLDQAGGLPLCIFRPSVVVATYREPVRGWTDNLYGPVAVLVGGAFGIVHCMRMNLELPLDTVPVDYVVNCMLAVAWRTGTSRGGPVPVYNFASTPVRPMCWKRIISIGLKNKGTWPFNKALWYVSCIYTESRWLYELGFFTLHRIPAIFVDKMAELSGEKFRLSRVYQKLYSMKNQITYFIFRTWEFKNENVMALWRLLSEQDQDLFYFDLRNVDVQEHFLFAKLGVKYYFFKEKLEDLPAAMRNNSRLYWLHNSVMALCGVAALKLMVVLARALPL